MRFFSSSALASAEKLRLAASCSAAETIESSLTAPQTCQIRARQIWGSGGFFALFTLRCQDFDRAAGLLDRGDGRLGGAVNLEIHLGLELAVAEQPHAVL